MSDATALPEVFRLSCPACGLAVLVESLDRWGCSRCMGPVAVEPIHYPAVLRAFAMIRAHFGRVEVADTEAGLAFLYRETGTPFKRLREEFESIGFLPFLRPFGAARLCRIVRRPRRKPMLLPRHIVFFVLTLITTMWVGLQSGERLVAAGQATSAVWVALSYAAALFAILGGHEMGHFAVARRTGTEASLPYFLPGPPPVGTFGATISLRTPAPDRDAAILLGAAGPVVGFLVSIPVLWYGLAHSPVRGLAGEPAIGLGQPLLFHLFGAAPELTTASIHPVAFAGWVGLLATTLNLLPIGQLDGGHIARSLLGEARHRQFSLFVLAVLFFFGLVLWQGWLVWAFFGLIVTFLGHPGALDEVKPLSPRSVLVAVLAVLVFALSVTPEPLRLPR